MKPYERTGNEAADRRKYSRNAGSLPRPNESDPEQHRGAGTLPADVGNQERTRAPGQTAQLRPDGGAQSGAGGGGGRGGHPLERVRPSVRKYAGKRGSGDAVCRVPANDQQCGDHRGRGRLRRQDPVPAVALSDAGRGPHAGRPRRERPVFRRPAASGRPQRGLVDRPYLDQRQGHRHARQLRRGRAGQQRTRRDHRKLVLPAGQRRPVSAGRQDRDFSAHWRTPAP